MPSFTRIADKMIDRIAPRTTAGACCPDDGEQYQNCWNEGCNVICDLYEYGCNCAPYFVVQHIYPTC
jgi:hypothetical protein